MRSESWDIPYALNESRRKSAIKGKARSEGGHPTPSIDYMHLCMCICCAILSLVLLCFNRHSVVIGINVHTPTCSTLCTFGLFTCNEIILGFNLIYCTCSLRIHKLKDNFVHKTWWQIQVCNAHQGQRECTLPRTNVFLIFVSNHSLYMNYKRWILLHSSHLHHVWNKSNTISESVRLSAQLLNYNFFDKIWISFTCKTY